MNTSMASRWAFRAGLAVVRVLPASTALAATTDVVHLRNDDLGIDLRTVAGAGFGRFVQVGGRRLWSVSSGLAVVNEQRAGSASAETNLEAFLGTDFEVFTCDTPKTSLVTTLLVFPSVTDAGRVRSNFDVSLQREVVKDLPFQPSCYHSCASDPRAEGESSDYGVVTSLGYSF